eukprot:GHUV01029189.1.p1 GENE.GHUV01029189.1~~GHUV01029189.1.p1  ORF type:complete len:185 (+),score=12.52 GHUV01029189.1:219-773(+)
MPHRCRWSQVLPQRTTLRTNGSPEMIRLCAYIVLLLCIEAARCSGTPGPTVSPYQLDVSHFQQNLQVLKKPPAWAHQRKGDYLLDFSKADAAVLQQQQQEPFKFRDLPLNVTHKQGYFYGNVAIVRFGTQSYLAVRKLQFYFTLRTDLPGYPLDKEPGGILYVTRSSEACFEHLPNRVGTAGPL